MVELDRTEVDAAIVRIAASRLSKRTPAREIASLLIRLDADPEYALMLDRAEFPRPQIEAPAPAETKKAVAKRVRS